MMTFDTTRETVAPRVRTPDVLSVRGEIDAASSGALRQMLRDRFETGSRDVVLDLAQVSFIDAAGLGVLVGALRRFKEGGGRLRVANPRRGVQRVLDVTGLSQILQ